jgi:hypothetical protein
MAKLVINPGTPQASEFELKPGVNYVGRGFANDLKIEDPSVSSSHCQIVVDGNLVAIKDLGSTNGTFINQAQVQEANLVNNQFIRLGNVQIVVNLEGAAPAPPMPPAIPSVTAGAASPTRPPVRISRPAAPVPEPAVAVEENAMEAPPPMPAAVVSGPRSCKFHPKSPARFLCRKCNQGFCDFCVSVREVGKEKKKLCRICGVDLVPLHVQVVREVHRGFFASLPGAFIYPFRGMGSVVLVLATVLIAGQGFLGFSPTMLIARFAIYGFIFLFLQNIIFGTAADESEALSLPEMSGVGGAALNLLGTFLVSFWLAFGLLIARFSGIDIPVGLIIAAGVLGCLYYPMAFLVVAIKDSVLAGNPLVVIPSIMKVPVQYVVTAMFCVMVFGIFLLGSAISSIAGGISMATTDMTQFFLALGVKVAWSLLSVYLLIVTVRILGLFYNANKEELAWF